MDNSILEKVLLAFIEEPSIMIGINSIHSAPTASCFVSDNSERLIYYERLLSRDKQWIKNMVFSLKCNKLWLTIYSDALVISHIKFGLDIIINHNDLEELKNLTNKSIDELKLLINFI